MPQTSAAPADQQQQLATITTPGLLPIIAGSGHGKTFPLVGPITHLIAATGITPDQFLFLTVTKKRTQRLTVRLSVCIPAFN